LNNRGGGLFNNNRKQKRESYLFGDLTLLGGEHTLFFHVLEMKDEVSEH